MNQFPKRHIQMFFKRFISPQPDPLGEEIQTWQEGIINVFLLLGSTLGLLVAIPSVSLSIKEGIWIIAVFDTGLYLWILVLFFRRSIPFKIKVYSMICLSYCLGVVLLLVVGPFGAGPVWLFFFPVITGILQNVRAAIIALVVNTLTLMGFGVLLVVQVGRWTYGPDLSLQDALSYWVVVLLNFMLLNAIATVASAMIVRGLQDSLNKRKRAYNELERKNAQLAASNQKLISEMEEKEKAQSNLRLSERALKESEIRFKELIDALPIGYILVDTDSKVRFINKTANDHFGLSSFKIDSLVHVSEITQIGETDQERIKHVFNRVIYDKAEDWSRFSVKGKNGALIPVETYIGPIVFENEVIAAQSIIVDISDRQEKENFRIAKNTAEKTNQAISEWVDFIAHEMRTPIGAPIGYASMGINKINQLKIDQGFAAMKESVREIPVYGKSDHIQKTIEEIENWETKFTNLTQTILKFLDRILSSTNRLNTLLNELLDLSKLEAGQMKFSFQPENIFTIVRDATTELESLVLGKKLALSVTSTKPEIVLECDAFRVGQVIRNLLSNSIKFTPEEKSISIHIQLTDIKTGRRKQDRSIPAVELKIVDEGIGVPPDQLSKIFNKFKQSRKSRIGEGTGLGLPICKEIIAAHNGSIIAENNESSGSTFRFILPLAQERSFQSRQQESVPPSTGTMNKSAT